MLLALVLPAAAAAAGAQAKIAFVKTDAGAKYSHLWTIAPDGTGLKRVTSASSNDLAPAWSPGRGTIAFIRSKSGRVYDRKAIVWLMRSDGSNQRQLTYTGPSMTSGSNALAFSPDGRYLAGGSSLPWHSDYGVLWAVTILDLKTKKSRVAVRYYCQNGVQSLSWAPDSKRLVATIEYGGGYGLLRVNVTDHNRLVKDSGFGNVESASWRPDGKYLLCTRWFTDLSDGPDYPWRTLLLTPSGRTVRTLGESQHHAVYSPDGSQYAFLQLGSWGEPSFLKVADGDGSNVTTIYRGASGEQLASPAWK
jgi:Tol biopolymer transport system component